MKFIYTVFIIILSVGSVVPCWTCRKFTYQTYIERIKFLVRLENSRPISNLTLIGSHSSLSFELPEDQRAQDLTLKQQLKYGVRVFDVDVEVQENSPEFIIQGFKLDEMLEEFDSFLNDNPGEMVILFVGGGNEENCLILRRYFSFRKAGRRLEDIWSLDDTLGMHRGSILLANLDGKFENCALKLDCAVQSDSTVGNEGNLKKKWQNIHAFMLESQISKRKCFVNDISFKGEKNSRRIVAKDAGYSTDGTCSRPLNNLLAQEFEPAKGFGVLFADFLTQELIDKVNDCNFGNTKWRIGWL